MMDSLTSTAKIACVVVTYNGAPWIGQCLQSLAMSQVAIDVIVVDNASRDETTTIIRRQIGVELIETGSNLGFGRANNIGIARALERGADYVLLLNQDAYLLADTVGLLHSTALAQPELGILCPLQLDADGLRIDPTFLRHYLASHAQDMLSDAVLARPLQTRYAIKAAPAAGWFLPRRFLLEVGGFDPLFFMYGEDDDLCARALHHGWGIALIPAARFHHCRGFHSGVQHQSRLIRLQRRTSRNRSSLLFQIKQPGGSMARNVWRSLVTHALMGGSALLAHFDWIEALATWAAIAKVLTELPRIATHRHRCMNRGEHWLRQPAVAAESIQH